MPDTHAPIERVDRLWSGETAVIMASGPSLTKQDVDFCRGKAHVLVINNGYQLAPWADVLYAADWRWWQWHKGAPDFTGLKFTVSRKAGEWPNVSVLRKGSQSGLSDDPTTLALGRNSGYQALNLAVHLGVARIILLGYDMSVGPKGAAHWHPEHPAKTPDHYDYYRRLLAKLVEPLRQRSIEVVNCSRRTALTAFPCAPLEQVLSEQDVAA